MVAQTRLNVTINYGTTLSLSFFFFAYKPENYLDLEHTLTCVQIPVMACALSSECSALSAFTAFLN